MHPTITATHERIDDRPVIIAHLKHMRVAPVLDNPFPTNGHGSGVSLGWVTGIWLTCMLSEGDHRRARVEPWGRAQQRTRSRLSGSQGKPRAVHDDRWATGLDSLRVETRWVACERERHQRVRRVDDLQARVARLDTTTAAACVTPEGLCQLGHSTEHRPDLPQVTS